MTIAMEKAQIPILEKKNCQNFFENINKMFPNNYPLEKILFLDCFFNFFFLSVCFTTLLFKKNSKNLFLLGKNYCSFVLVTLQSFLSFLNLENNQNQKNRQKKNTLYSKIKFLHSELKKDLNTQCFFYFGLQLFGKQKKFRPKNIASQTIFSTDFLKKQLSLLLTSFCIWSACSIGCNIFCQASHDPYIFHTPLFLLSIIVILYCFARKRKIEKKLIKKQAEFTKYKKTIAPFYSFLGFFSGFFIIEIYSFTLLPFFEIFKKTYKILTLKEIKKRKRSKMGLKNDAINSLIEIEKFLFSFVCFPLWYLIIIPQKLENILFDILTLNPLLKKKKIIEDKQTILDIHKKILLNLMILYSLFAQKNSSTLLIATVLSVYLINNHIDSYKILENKKIKTNFLDQFTFGGTMMKLFFHHSKEKILQYKKKNR